MDTIQFILTCCIAVLSIVTIVLIVKKWRK